MYKSHADTLESYLIPAEEGVFDTIKNTYKKVKNSKGIKVASSVASGIGAAYTVYSASKDITKGIKKSMISSKVREIEKLIKYTLLSRHDLISKLKLVSDFNQHNTTICYLVSQSNLNDMYMDRLHALLAELKKSYKFIKYRIGSTEEYELLVKIYY